MKGQWVKCVDDYGMQTIHAGEFYCIAEVICDERTGDLTRYALMGLNGYLKPERFRPLTGKLVQCINTDGLMQGMLTLGKLYQVKFDTETFAIDNDMGFTSNFSKSRFNVIFDPAVVAITVPAPKLEAVEEDERLKELRFFAKSCCPNTCRCGAPLPCEYHR